MRLSISSARFGANRHKTCDWLKIVWVLCTLNGPEVICDGKEPTEPKWIRIRGMEGAPDRQPKKK